MPVVPAVPAAASVPQFDRRTALERLRQETFDLLVIGGGVTGCGVALDAATRGLKTALVEAGDFGSGTSSKSSKLVHGGLRYLQQHDYLLVYEALHERQRLIRNAPHLVHPLPFLIPLFGKDGVVSKSVAKAYSGALWLYDLTGGVRIGHRHRRVGAEDALAHFPALRTDRLVAAFLYWDAQADDARLTLALARTAAAHGAVLANYSPAVALVEDDGGAAQVRGARLADGTVVRAHRVVNAGGVWSQRLGRMARGPADGTRPSGGEKADPIGVPIRPAKGIHLAVPADRLPCDYASVLVVPGDRRSIFVVPWAADEDTGQPARAGLARYTYVGTTDTDYDGPLDEPRCTPEDVAYLLAAVNAWTSAGLTPDDVTGSWAGLRPLISDAKSARTADLSRRHRVTVSAGGLVTVTGGKLTTYRKMAADTVDAVVGLDRNDGGRRARSATRRLVLIGGEDRGRPPLAAVTGARRLGLSDEAITRLASRYGRETGVVVGICEARPELAAPLSPELPYLRAEAVHAARHEMAQTVGDVLSRRTRASILNRAAACAVAGDVAELLGAELGWDADERDRQVTAFLHQMEAERAAGAGPGREATAAGRRPPIE